MRYFITGHTGFKGSWLTLWLASQGHEVYGLSLDPEPGSLFELAGIGELCSLDQRGDIRDSELVNAAIKNSAPDVVVHMAAQPLVLDSYKRPRWTMETNVMGTLNVLEAVGIQKDIKALLVVTTDKVYRNLDQRQGYLETDALGGDDPYSASKAMADILTHSWAKSFPGTRTAVARAGNVIGGGDVSPDRLLPDIVANLRAGSDVVLRHPDAVRPWQHVLDCLNGYRMLVDALISAKGDDDFDDGWNFGPDAESFVSVGKMTTKALKYSGSHNSWSAEVNGKLHEAQFLSLDSNRAKRTLGWGSLLGVDDALMWTLDWHKEIDSGLSAREVTLGQINKFRHLMSQI